MPIIGLLLGAPLGNVLGAAAEYIAVTGLIGLGLYMTINDDDDSEGVRQLANARGVRVLLPVSASPWMNSPSASPMGCCACQWSRC